MSTQQLVESMDELLLKEWLECERELIKRMVENVVSYKRLIPKSIKDDIIALLQLANKIKSDFDLVTRSVPAQELHTQSP
jgi:hypothetical protein